MVRGPALSPQVNVERIAATQAPWVLVLVLVALSLLEELALAVLHSSRDSTGLWSPAGTRG